MAPYTIHHTNSSPDLDAYMSKIYAKCEKNIPPIDPAGKKKHKKGNKDNTIQNAIQTAKHMDENIIVGFKKSSSRESIEDLVVEEAKATGSLDFSLEYIPQIGDHNMIYQNNYNVQQLKRFAKHYKMKRGGNKPQLSQRLFCFLKLSYGIRKIQQRFRGHLLRRCLKSQGPAFRDRSCCTNSTDFLTMEPVEEIACHQFFSYKDEDGFIYGFDVPSLYNLILKSNPNPNISLHEHKPVQNPYNRNIIPVEAVKQFKYFLRLSKIFHFPVELHIKNPLESMSVEKSTELRVLELFQNIDALGNYSSPVWFHTLNRNQMFKMMVELRDIWAYRAQLSNEVKRAICPPHGDPFQHLNVQYIHRETNMDNIKRYILTILEKFVNTGIDVDSKTLGAYYVLGALTLVNENAAASLPWLYQSLHFS